MTITSVVPLKPLLMKSNPVEQLCHNSVLAEFKFNFHSYPQDFLC